ncbi:GNAT family N-acetyltransferase [Dactylosporangium sp. AC04546]|uniref:GNAT family N-acetyltransferase n=1 Tax=Dactylosporangium sp. AC04546 TaxID=2862460 RepID=UPI001EDD2DCB|nr:GNAT family N-acetyltransferase [Dactylosporangium sp. AC04546]WVK80050.1 GNAT family N-acetyltransferase [Dactylosporangium sp. AC04546]
MTGDLMIRMLTAGAYAEAVTGLGEVLADAVADGASLGFRDPFDPAQAADWWRSRQHAVADGSLTVWAAYSPAGVVGTVSLASEPKPNGRHRGEVLKLIVHRAARGRGLGRELLTTAERAAAERDLTLLLLDTATGSPAERLYETAGWTRYGIVPDYAADPAGVLEDCTFFYKRLDVMRAAFMPTREELRSRDMTLGLAHPEPRHPGARRRR